MSAHTRTLSNCSLAPFLYVPAGAVGKASRVAASFAKVFQKKPRKPCFSVGDQNIME